VAVTVEDYSFRHAFKVASDAIQNVKALRIAPPSHLKIGALRSGMELLAANVNPESARLTDSAGAAGEDQASIGQHVGGDVGLNRSGYAQRLVRGTPERMQGTTTGLTTLRILVERVPPEA